MNLTHKQNQFNTAMGLYETRKIYKIIGVIVSISNISLQGILLYRISSFSIGLPYQFISIVSAYTITDFINGLVHMYMDNNDNYESFAGPIIANFHLHHKNPRYKDSNLFVVYFKETGSKIWLVFFLSGVLLYSFGLGKSQFLLVILVYIGIFSSIAELSHYLCHNSKSNITFFLMRIHVLLPKRKHAKHHLHNNIGYTFLNGCTDPLVNAIAKKYCKGYKNGTDLHYAKYIQQTKTN